MSSHLSRSTLGYALLILAALLAPLMGIYPVFLMKLLCFAMFACAYNLLLGFGRMLSFGHAAFFGAAAYATSWLVTAHAFGPAAAIAAGVGSDRSCSIASSSSAASGVNAPEFTLYDNGINQLVT